MHKAIRKLLRTVANYDPEYYDMHDDPNESSFAQCYLDPITAHAAATGITPPSTVLEAGCQAGRLVVPLAKRGFRVTGLDTSGFALRRAKQHVRQAGVDATFVRGGILEALSRQPQVQYDIVICAEVLYLSQQYRQLLRTLAGAVRPGGLLCVSHRPKFYYLLEAMKQYDLDAARYVATHQEGPCAGGGYRGYFNWQTEAELRALYEALELRWLAAHPIDRLVWLAGLSPSTMTPAQQHQWLQLERELDEARTVGRYLLVIAQRPLEGLQG